MRKRKWALKEQALFLKKTSELLIRGYPLSEAIESLAYQLPVYRKQELGWCNDWLKKGHPFHIVLERLGFNIDLIGYVYFAEQHGNFAEAVLEGSRVLLNRDRDLKKLATLFYYPVFLLFITALLFIFLQKSLLPRFTFLFETLGLEENRFSRMIMLMGDLAPYAGSGLLIALLVVICIYLFYFKKLPILSQRRIALTIPFVGELLKLLHTHYFSIQLSYLLNGGLSVFEALQFFESNSRQLFYSQASFEIKKKLVTGENFESIVASMPFFGKELPMVIKHGQENGKLGQELYFFSQHCVGLLEEKMDRMLKIVQPVLYLVIATLVISMYLAILMPMFHLMDGI